MKNARFLMATCAAMALVACGEGDTVSTEYAEGPAGSGITGKADGARDDASAPIPDNDWRGVTRTLDAQSPVTRVWVEIEHTYRGDLRVVLIAPNGDREVLHARRGGGADDLSIDWTVPEALQLAGTWKLHVSDHANADVGVLRAWGTDEAQPECVDCIVEAGEGEMCAGIAGIPCAGGLVCEVAANYPDAAGTCVAPEGNGDSVVERPNAPIPDNRPRGVVRTLRADAPVSRVWVEIEHTYRGDLRVVAKAPNGVDHVLHNRTGGGAEDLSVDWMVPASAQVAGTWTLWVVDTARLDTGTLTAWGLDTVGAGGGNGGDAGCGHCPAGTECQEIDVQCFRAPCPAIFECVDINPGPGPGIPPPAAICDGEIGLTAPVTTCADERCDRPYGDAEISDAIDRPSCDGSELRTWQGIDGTPRYACVFRPDGAHGALPMVVWLHGALANADHAFTKTNLGDNAKNFDLSGEGRPGFVLVAIQGRNLNYPTEAKDGRHWDHFHRDLASPSANPDMAIIDDVLDTLVGEGGVDTDRIYTMGHSNGGFLAQMYAIARHDTPTPGGVRVAATSVFSTGDPFSELLLQQRHDDGTSCMLDSYPRSTVPLMFTGRDCDKMACSTRQAEDLADRGRDSIAAEPGHDVEQWMSALDDKVGDRNVRRVILTGFGRVTNRCARWCGPNMAWINHTLWPRRYESEMLSFLRQNPLR